MSAGSTPNLLLVPGQRGCCRGACSPLIIAVSEELQICQSDASGVPAETLSCYFGLGSPQSLHATVILTTDTLILFDTSTSFCSQAPMKHEVPPMFPPQPPQKHFPDVLEEAELLHPRMRNLCIWAPCIHLTPAEAAVGQTGTTSRGS